ncbi:zinc ribbon domain-containing protein [Streptomyces sp. NPDC050842]|uniref:zinc ribbon domain-containing protein n=1 Tax=Streptomyces sp. NPDC050842 TaxID=3365636 RepID=UPI0037B65E6F
MPGQWGKTPFRQPLSQDFTCSSAWEARGFNLGRNRLPGAEPRSSGVPAEGYRVTQARFVCRSCGTVMHADHNGSRNIAHRGDAVWKRGAVNRPRTSTR